ncbi:MAG: GspE/PulE family protein [Gammaproteobacteria bacterium]
MNSAEIPAFPLPPLCTYSQEDSVNSGERVIVNLQDGRLLVGVLLDFDPEKGVTAIKIPSEKNSTTIKLDQVKILNLPTLRHWVRSNFKPTANEEAFRMPPEKQDFNIQFKDGDSLKGQTLGFKTDGNGMYLYPLQDNEKFFCIFIQHGVIKEYNIGPPLGELLVQDQLATEEEVEMSLQIQRVNRQQPLGHYLRDRAVVTTKDLERALELQKSVPNLKLGEILINEKLISEEQLNVALELQKQNRDHSLGEILVNQKLVTQSDIQSALAKKMGIPYVDLDKFEIDHDAIDLVTETLVRKYSVLPLYIYENTLVVAVENPMRWEPLEAVRFHTRMKVEPVMAPKEEINRIIDLVYSTRGLDDLFFEDFDIDYPNFDSPDVEIAESDNVVVKLVNKIIIGAYKDGASDIHFEPDAGGAHTQVRIRKDGSLIAYCKFPASLRRAVPSRIKVMSGLNLSERRKPQDGKIDFSKFSQYKIELRVATLPTVGGVEDIVLRILAGGEPLPLSDLGLSESNHRLLLKLIDKPYGLFIVCGPTGSGKTTTLHSTLAELNTPDRKIWTVEDPVEITQKGLRQVQVHAKIGLNFAAVMRSFLRADPDIIMLGEMRDEETTGACIEASLTGHLVFSTLHTNSAPESIVRLLDMGMDPFNFADALIGILAQRLAKKLCPNCKVAYRPGQDELEDLAREYCLELSAHNPSKESVETLHVNILADWKKQYADRNGEFTLFRAGKCMECHDTGYKGRVALHELLQASESVKKQIVESAPVAKILETALKEGMLTLKQDGIGKVFLGLTDIQQVRKVCIK